MTDPLEQVARREDPHLVALLRLILERLLALEVSVAALGAKGRRRAS